MPHGRSFDPRHNSLNAVRLALAAAVVVSHTWPLGGYGSDPALGDRSVGSLAVAGFFAISGYLITRSRMSGRSAASFYRARLLRIYPGFIVAMLMVAVVFAPLVHALDDDDGRSYDWHSAVLYVVRNGALYMRQWGIDGTLTDTPYPTTWNGSAWTLFFEFVCYLGIGVAVSVVPRRALTSVVAAGGVVACAITLLATVGVATMLPDLVFLASLASFFCAGSLLFLVGRCIRYTHLGGAAAAGACALFAVTETFGVLAPLPLAYLVMYLGAALPLHQVAHTHDLSYGVYIYAFPVQQSVTQLTQGGDFPLAAHLAVSLTVTSVLAAASWFLVERPALRFKSPAVRPRRASTPARAQ